MPGVVKNVLTTVEYTLDDPDGAPTYVELPVVKILNEGDRPNAEAQTAETINGLQGQAAELLQGGYVVAVDDDDTFWSDLEDAANNWDPVWFRETPQGQDPRRIGGASGCLITVTRQRNAFGNVETKTIGFTASGANADDTFDVETSGS